MKETEIFPCDVCGEPIQIGQEIQSEVDGDILLHHADCEFETCTDCGELIAPGEECYHDHGPVKSACSAPRATSLKMSAALRSAPEMTK
jgi:hypothetical protein